MWLLLCMFVFVLPIRYADSSLADQMAEITQLCCNQGTTYARNHSSEDCSSSIPPDVDSTFGTLCIFAMDQCCKEYFTKKSDCESGIDLATSSKTCASMKDTGKKCCDHCMSGRAVGKTRGISACTAIVQGKTGEQLLAGDAFTQCCKNAVENESKTPSKPTTALAKKPTEYDLSPVASVCEEYAPNELCAHHCIPIPGSYKCECNPGFMLMADGRNCREVTKNRCKPHNPCQHKCNDNGVQVKCSCRRGYQLMSDGKSCEDIDECNSDPPVCLPNTQCFNILGSYKCIPLKNKNNPDKGHCPPGFARNLLNNACDDINECNLPNPPCPRFICENTIGGYKCGGVSGDPGNLSNKPHTPVEDRCPPGFVSGFNEECEDIDECSIGKDDCNKLSQFCINTRGAFYCQDKVSKHCPPGFKTNSVTNKCEDINECEDGQDICRSDQICINVPGEYDCKPKGNSGRNVNYDCPDGMRKNQATNICEDIDECTEGTHLCDQYQRCLNTNGSHECHCKLGFELDPKTRACIDINECATDQNNCISETQRCDNTVGSYLCIRFISCGTGYTLHHSSSTCEDIDECALGIHNCERAGPEYQCMNIPGSFRCQKPAPPPPEYEYEYYDEDEDVDPGLNKTEVITTTTLTPTTTETPKTTPRTTPVPTTKPTEPTPEEPKEVVTEKTENISIDNRINAIDKEADKRKPNINFYETEPPRQPDYSYSSQPNYNNLEPHIESEIPKGADPNRIYFEPEPPKLPEYPSFENAESNPTDKGQENVEPRQPNYYKPTEYEPSESSQPNYYKPTESNQPNYYKPTEDIPHEPKETNYNEQTEPTRTDQVTPEIDNSIPIVYPGITETTYSPIPEYPTSPKLINVIVGQETASVRGEKNEDGSVSVDTKDLPRNEWTTINKKPNCQNGFELDQYGTCFDIDECATNRHSCSGLTEVCRNTVGGYLCDCAIGFRRDIPSMSCIPVTTSTSTTTTTTTSTTTPAPTTSSTRSYFWSYYGHKRPTSRPFRPRSSCDVGYHFNSETRKCEDVNECVNGQANCADAEICVNTEGGFRCECPPNWKLDSDRHRCVPNRSYSDIFPPDYRKYPGYPPVDPNEIISGPKGPKALAEPEITQVGDRGTVLKCPWGTRLGDDGTCEDVDECVTGEAQCGPLQICTNLHGGYTCSCPLGHRLVGDHMCEDVDECALSGNIPICSVNADCVNTIGSYQCRCHEGFKSAPANDKVCVDVDECSESYSGSLCQHRCNNVWGGYRCSCHRGYRLNADNRTCYDVDECTEFKNKNLCIGRCNNEPGSYRCSCPSGYRLSEDNRSCIDIDECETGEAPCSHGGQYAGSSDVCLNTRGSYRCYKITCPPGYQLEQKHRCTKIQRNCPPADWECAHQPSTYSYNFITFVSNLYIPESKVDLFTMRGPAWPGATMRFQLRVVSVDAPPTVKEKADINSFLLVQTNNQAVMSLVKPLEGLQSIELELSMELYSRGQFGGIAVAKIFIHVSEFEF